MMLTKTLLYVLMVADVVWCYGLTYDLPYVWVILSTLTRSVTAQLISMKLIFNL